MATKVTVRLPVIDALKDVLSPKNSQKVGKEIIESSRALIATGQSPVAGYGRFENYSGAKQSIGGKKKANKGYPFNVQKQYPNKQVRPVNLELTGEMLDALEVKPTGTGPRVGIFDSAMSERARKHNLGDPDHGIPERHFWPTRAGEKFTATIQRNIKDTYADIVGAILKKNNKS